MALETSANEEGTKRTPASETKAKQRDGDAEKWSVRGKALKEKREKKLIGRKKENEEYRKKKVKNLDEKEFFSGIFICFSSFSSFPYLFLPIFLIFFSFSS